MPFQVSPKVNVSEIDLTTSVPAISTTEAAHAGHFRWGPVGKRVLVNSENVLVQNFREPDSNTAVDFFVCANFLAYANQLYVSRAINTVDTGSTTRNAHANVANNATDTVVKNEDDYEENYSQGISGVGDWIAKYPGQLGNSLKVSLCASATAWSSTLTGQVAISRDTKVLSGNSTSFDTEVTAGDILILGPGFEQREVDAVTNATSLTLVNNYSSNTIVFGDSNSTNTERRWEYYNYFDEAPGTSDFVASKGGSGDEVHMVIADEDGEWTGIKGQVLETFSSASLASDAKTDNGSTNYYKNVINRRSSYIWWAAHNSDNTSAGSKASGTTFSGASSVLNASLVNGRDGNPPGNADLLDAYDLFKSTEDVDVSFIIGGDADQTLASYLIQNIAESRKDCVACVSPERSDVVNNSNYSGAEMDDIIAYRNSLPSSSYGIMDSGWKYQYDRYNDVERYIPLNGDIAGLMARTDNIRDPWWSPGGFNRGNIKNVIRLAYNPPEAQRDQLYKKGINPVATFPGQGTVLFGDRTMLLKPSAFSSINVRRLFIVLEKAIATASKFTLFEFNDEFTRARFRNLVEPFLRDVQGRRGIIDFRVVADETNNTPEVVDRQEFIGDIYIKPARSINYIQLNFVAVRSGVSFEEIVGQF